MATNLVALSRITRAKINSTAPNNNLIQCRDNNQFSATQATCNNHLIILKEVSIHLNSNKILKWEVKVVTASQIPPTSLNEEAATLLVATQAGSAMRQPNPLTRSSTAAPLT